MSEFGDLVRQFSAKATGIASDVFLNSASDVLDSIQNGSEVTGSPGQPVGQYGPGYHPGKTGGELKASWELELGTTEAIIATASPYAVQNEYGVSATGGAYVQRSTVGGRHSVELTVTGFDKIVAANVAESGER